MNETKEEYIRKEMMKITNGEFVKWYDNLPGYLQDVYKREFDKLQTKYDNF